MPAITIDVPDELVERLREGEDRYRVHAARFGIRIAQIACLVLDALPRPIAVGDRVHDIDGDLCTVLAVDDDEAWVRCETGLSAGHRFTVDVADLRHAPAEEVTG